jgi:hypothetical protein
VAIEDREPKQQEEKLVIPEADAVVDPRTMMVHLQNAGAAHSAMMASIRLVLATPLAVPTFASTLQLLEIELARLVPIVSRTHLPVL